MTNGVVEREPIIVVNRRSQVVLHSTRELGIGTVAPHRCGNSGRGGQRGVVLESLITEVVVVDEVGVKGLIPNGGGGEEVGEKGKGAADGDNERVGVIDDG